MKFYKSCNLYTFLLMFSSNLFAQDREFILLKNFANAFYYNDDNNLWVSSENGWNRYDGIKTYHYEIGDTISGLKGNWIQSTLYPDNLNNLWTCTYEYLCYYDGTNQGFYCMQPVVNGDTLRSDFKIIGYDRVNEELIYRSGDSIYSYFGDRSEHLKTTDDKTQCMSFLNNSTSNDKFRINEIICSPWLIDNTIEYWKKNKNNWDKEIFPFENCKDQKESIIVSQISRFNNQLWCATNLGLLKFNLNDHCKSQIFNPDKFNLDINHLALRDSFFYITTESEGLWLFDLKNETFVKNYSVTSADIQLFSNTPVEIFSDDNHLYLSHRNQGVQRIPFYKFDNLIEFGSKKPNKIDHLDLVNDNIVVVIENGIGIWILNKNLSFIDFHPFDKSLIVIDVKASEKGFYYCNYFNLYEYDVSSNKSRLIKSGKSKQIYMLTSYNDSLAIVSSANLYVLNESQLSYRKVDFDSQLYGYYEYNHDHTIAATGSSNVRTVFNIDTTFSDLKKYVNTCIYSDVADRFHIGTSDGLYFLSKGSNNWQKLDSWQLNNKKINDLKVDSTNLYITTEEGFYLLKDNQQLLKLNIGSKQFDGNRQMEIVGNQLVWNENEKLFSINKNEIYYSDDDSISISKCTYSFDKLDEYLNMTYKWKDTPPSFHFTYSNYLHNENGLYRYKIDGIQNDYKTVSISDSLSMPVLSQGDYTISIIGLNQDLTESNRLNISLEVSGPFYMQWWFFILMPSMIFGLLYWYFHTKTKRLMKIHTMNQEISALEKSALQAQMNPHFIFNCLNAIQNFISQNDKEYAMDYLGKFAKLIRQYLNASVSDMITLDEEISMLNTYCELESLRFSERFVYEISLHEDIDTMAVRLPSMLIQPFVENAIIHGMKSNANGFIKVQFNKINDHLNVTIEDNGKGFDQSKVNIRKSLGMSITQKRLQHIQSTAGEDYQVSVNSTDSGTSIQLHIPIKAIS